MEEGERRGWRKRGFKSNTERWWGLTPPVSVQEGKAERLKAPGHLGPMGRSNLEHSTKQNRTKNKKQEEDRTGQRN
jgi:hypothetical protein